MLSHLDLTCASLKRGERGYVANFVSPFRNGLSFPQFSRGVFFLLIIETLLSKGIKYAQSYT